MYIHREQINGCQGVMNERESSLGWEVGVAIIRQHAESKQ